MPKTSVRGLNYNIFLAVSYGASCTNEQGVIRGYRNLLECIVTSLERSKLRVYLAPREEQWGARRPSREVGIRRDISALRDASTFIIFLNGNQSDGALVELGIALALEKFIWILRRPSEALPSYLSGLFQFEYVCLREIDNEDDIATLVQEIRLKYA